MSQTLIQPDFFPDENEVGGGWVNVSLQDGSTARWRSQGKVVRLEIAGKKINVTREGAGREGRPRFCANGIVNARGLAVQARNMNNLARGVFLALKAAVKREVNLAIERAFSAAAPPAPRKIGRRSKTVRKELAVRQYFNPFKWASSREKDGEFVLFPNCLNGAPFTAFEKILYSRLLWPEAPAFCASFNQPLGLIVNLNCGALAKKLGRNSQDQTEVALRALEEKGAIEIQGSKGHTKNVRFLVTNWMSDDMRSSTIGSVKTTEPIVEVSVDFTGPNGGASGKSKEPPEGQRKESKKSRFKESTRTEATDGQVGEAKENRDLSDEEDLRFARAVQTITSTKLGKRFARFLGKEQMVYECRQSGAWWVRIIQERSTELDFLLEQGERVAASDLKTGKAKAKFLTARLHERQQPNL